MGCGRSDGFSIDHRRGWCGLSSSVAWSCVCVNINASIVDQRITGILEEHPGWFSRGKDLPQNRSTAFVLLCISVVLDITMAEAAELLTDGGNDAGVDGLHLGEVDDGEFMVTLFQGKYKTKDLSGAAHFPENSVQKSVHTITTLFDPAKRIELNPRIKPAMEEIRSLVREGYIPNVRMVLCNNGAQWNDQAQSWIDQSGLPDDQIRWTHCNHDTLVEILRKTKAVDETLRFSGKAVVEDFNFRRVFLGKVQVTEMAELFNRQGDRLLERNIRRYLGRRSNRVNTAIYDTLQDESKRDHFYFFNNGITLVCRKFRYNALQGDSFQVKLENVQVINGGQTCKTIQEALNRPTLLGSGSYENAYVLVRIYELSEEDQDFVHDITCATNSQNPVDLRDLRSNDVIQQQLELGIKDLGYVYRRQREEGMGGGAHVVTSSIVAESVLAIWREKPHQAKFRRREHFGKLYEDIFSGLNAAQAVLAVMIFRAVENERKRPTRENPAEFLPYASHYISMLVGRALLVSFDQGFALSEVSHNHLKRLLDCFETRKHDYHQHAIDTIRGALKACYGDRPISLQQLSATFRRGDLLEYVGPEVGEVSAASS